MNRVVRAVRAFAAFWWDFIVGDDWRIAAGVIVALAATAALAAADVPAWWLLPLAVAVLLGLSLRRATRPRHTP
jgi:predicted ABC-type sugar transport system permease subunit